MSELNFIQRYENNKDEQKVLLTLLRAYAVAEEKKLKLPSVTFLDEISGQLDVSRSRAKDIADDFKRKHFKVSNFNLNKSESLYLGMYNATIDTGNVINLNEIKRKVQEDGFKEEEIDGFKIKAVKFNTRYGRFKKSFEYTQEYGSKNLIQNKDASTAQFILKIQKGNEVQGASFNIYKTGRVRFSAGYFTGDQSEPKALVKYISRNFQPIDGRLPIELNNTTAEIKINATIKIIELYTIFNVTKGLASFENFIVNTTFEPERDQFIVKQRKNSPFLYVTLTEKDSKNKLGLVISRSGNVIIEGAKNVRVAVDIVTRFLTALKESGLMTKTVGKNLKVSPKKTKLARRVNMKPAPDVTRRGTSCPFARRPDPYGFQGTCSPQLKGKHYVRPNPQGQPCCYKVPKSTSYINKKVENRYKRANVKVPNAVRKTFGFGENTNNKANNVGRMNTNMNIFINKSVGRNGVNPIGLKIGSRQCLRFSKVALVDIAKRKGISLPKKTTKPILCDLLSKVAVEINSNNPLPRLNQNGRVIIGKQVCETYKKSTLTRYARALGIQVNKDMSKPDICKSLKSKLKGKSPKRKTPTPPKRKTPTPPKRKTPTPNRAGPSRIRTPTPPKRKTPTPNRAGPSRIRTPTPNNSNANDENFSNLMNFAKRLRAL